MNFKKYILIVLILIAILAFITPINAITIHKIDESTVYYSNGKSMITTVIYSKIGSDSEMRKDLDQVDKILVKVNKKTVKIIKKIKVGINLNIIQWG